MHDKHRERLRQTYLSSGADSFHDHELLELLLTYTIPRVDTNATAHNLINTFGTLEKVFSANPYDLKKVEGIGEYSAIMLSLVGSILMRVERGGAKQKIITLNTPDDAMTFCRKLFLGEKYEKTYAISLDGGHRVLHVDKVGSGTINETVVYARLVVECALRHGASSVVLTHNHPSGNPNPSREDIRATESVSKALNGISITLHDHIIIARNSAFSMTRTAILSYDEASNTQLRAADKEQ